MEYEIHRKTSCKPKRQSMQAWLLAGRSRPGELTTSCYGQLVVIVKEWGGLVPYADIKKIIILKDGSDSEKDINAEYENLKEKFSRYGIEI